MMPNAVVHAGQMLSKVSREVDLYVWSRGSTVRMYSPAYSPRSPGSALVMGVSQVRMTSPGDPRTRGFAVVQNGWPGRFAVSDDRPRSGVNCNRNCNPEPETSRGRSGPAPGR